MTPERRPVSAGVVLTLVLAAVLQPAPSFAAKGDCGQPSSTGATPKSSDSLFALKAAVGTNPCDLCVCDVTNDSKITSTDALKILKKGVGQDVELTCPACLPTLTGTVLLPSPLLSSLAAGPESAGLVVGLTGLVPVPGATVELLKIDKEGTPLLPVLATTTSSADGSYKFSPAPEPSSTTIVRTTIDAATVRAFVNGNTVNLDPSSEFVVAAAQEAANSDVTSDLGELSIAEIDSLLGLVRQADVDFSSTATLPDALAHLDDSTGGVYRDYVRDFASDDGSIPGLQGSFHLVNLGMTFSRSFVPAGLSTPSVNTRSVHLFSTSDPLAIDAEGNVTQPQTTGFNHTLTEVSGTDPVEGAINASAAIFHGNVNQVPGGATGTLLAADGGRLLANALGTVAAGSYASGADFGVLPGTARVNADTGFGAAGFLLRQGSGMANGSLSGGYWAVQYRLEVDAETDPGNVYRANRVYAQRRLLTFDGSGSVDFSKAEGQQAVMEENNPLPGDAAEDPVVLKDAINVSEDPILDLPYTLSADGELVIDKGDAVYARGAASPDGNIVVLVRSGSDQTYGISEVLIAVKRGSDMNNGSGAGTYRSVDLNVSLYSDLEPGTVDIQPSTNFRSIGFSGSVGSIDFDGAGGIGVKPSVSRRIGLNKSSGVLERSTPPNEVLDASTSIRSDTDAENTGGAETHTYAVASNGTVTIDAADNGGMLGFLSPDGKVFVLPIGGGEGGGLEGGVLIALREP